MHDYRKWEIESGIPPERRLRPEELIARTADPADALITSLLLNRDFKIEIPDLPVNIADAVIAKIKGRTRSC